jgi:hypothetical protein
MSGKSFAGPDGRQYPGYWWMDGAMAALQLAFEPPGIVPQLRPSAPAMALSFGKGWALRS